MAHAGGRRDHSRQQSRCHQGRWRPCVLFAGDRSHPDAAAIGLRDGARVLRNPPPRARVTGVDRASRLNRDLRNRFGSHDYAREELQAEISQMMVCAELEDALSPHNTDAPKQPPTVALSSGSVATVRSIHLRRITSRCRRIRPSQRRKDIAEPLRTSYVIGRAQRLGSIAICETGSVRMTTRGKNSVLRSE